LCTARAGYAVSAGFGVMTAAVEAEYRSYWTASNLYTRSLICLERLGD
jgi:hypothetical protein